ncbi:hypothetical protein [Aliiroseovarius subalbicans]|uniref:hypothetical protein n=1 Tax=Aliiroseovarius subalbicans TaxID=2925840 RepID=UPI001F55EC41|nr:hypothetical protein [Aliiroseovarius subalbicans]MCI2400490.1 hypothetical protein [Aliiroseovarius subalbicans]
MSFHLDGPILSQEDGWTLDLTQVTRVAFVQTRVKSNVFRHMDLWQGDLRHSVSWSGLAGDWTTDPEAFAFLDLCSATADALAKVQPDLRITWGTYGRSRKWMFAIGLIALIAGLGLFPIAALSGVATSKLLTAAIPMIALVLIGSTLVAGYAPWRKQPTLAAGDLRGVLTRIAERARAPQS